MAYRINKTRIWHRQTPNDGELFDNEFARIYENFRHIKEEDFDIRGRIIISRELTVGNGITGNLTGDVTGNLEGNVTGNITGNVNSNQIITENISVNNELLIKKEVWDETADDTVVQLTPVKQWLLKWAGDDALYVDIDGEGEYKVILSTIYSTGSLKEIIHILYPTIQRRSYQVKYGTNIYQVIYDIHAISNKIRIVPYSIEPALHFRLYQIYRWE